MACPCRFVFNDEQGLKTHSLSECMYKLMISNVFYSHAFPCSTNFRPKPRPPARLMASDKMACDANAHVQPH
jgi:hypothetical protein